MAETALVEACTDLLAGTDRHGRLHHQDRPPLELGQLVDDGPDPGQVGVAGVRRWGVDAHEEKLAVGEVGDVERVGQSARIALEELRDVLFVKRHLAEPEGVDLLGDDVADDDVVTQVGEAGTRDEPDPAGAEDAYFAHRGGSLLPGC